MVAHQRNLAASKVKTAHAVSLVRHGKPVIHHVAKPGNDAVGKALRQIEQTGRVCHQRAVSGRPGRCPAHARTGGAAAGGQCGKGAGSGVEKLAAVECGGHGQAPSGLAYHGLAIAA